MRVVPEYCPPDQERNKAQQRLLKRPANFFAGWLGRIVRTPVQIPFYQELTNLYNGLTGTDRLESIDDVFGMFVTDIASISPYIADIVATTCWVHYQRHTQILSITNR